ncbi:hypothetical protein [Actinomadura rugatobispora]|uniref:Blue (type 1) copper domain-containing protein n=1 Tax=Actinomadura rugatobispora TaxID=1994 RepID=A0ABW1AF33_9ACTN|nr:hypothetical protein GCM10010200_033080 [Actinomadura rugatobispora]
MMWGSPGHWLGMGVIMALFWGLIIAGAFVLVRRTGGARRPRRPEGNSGPSRQEEVLAERFARGEIGADEYERHHVRDTPVNPTGHHWGRLAAGTAAALVLGTASTAALAGTLGGRNGGPPDAARLGAAYSGECRAPALAGSVVNVDLTDMGAMMGTRHGPGPLTGRFPGGRLWPMRGMMRLSAVPTQVREGTVSLRAYNTGAWPHEVLVMPLPTGQHAGQRPFGTGDTVAETGSLGEASRTCGAGAGPMGIAPGTAGWTTLRLAPGRYELICNLPGHYAAGMYTELDVTR